jgi:hypothetical protein
VKEAGTASEARAVAGVTVPLVQERLTVTEAALFGTKSLLTTKNALFCVFVIVQEALPPGLITTPAQFVWLAV